MHQRTHQISCKPPALRAMVTSSLPYFSSADALQAQNHDKAKTPYTMMSLPTYVCVSNKRFVSSPHFQKLLHVLTCPSAIVKSLNKSVIPNIADKVCSLEPEIPNHDTCALE